ncbi:MAG TPA: methyltransferase domain-containing protein [Candidatus Thermoplasmatota archaeon]|nr:methyltransferase domain-containing protein [Candidatus Thermoplasmatota archaeon]
MFLRGYARKLQRGLVPKGTKWEEFPRRVNLGCGTDYREGWTNVDRYAARADERFDLFRMPWPMKDASVDYVLASQFLEHVPPRIGDEDGLIELLGEVHRVLRPGGLLHVAVPYAGSDNDYNNITHYRHFIPTSLDFLDPERTRNPPLSAQAPVRFRIHKVHVTRSFRATRLFDSGYHMPKYLGIDLNVGRKRGLTFLLEKVAADGSKTLKAGPRIEPRAGRRRDRQQK